MWQGKKCECILIIIPIDITSEKKYICIKVNGSLEKNIHMHTQMQTFTFQNNYFTITEFYKVVCYAAVVIL